MRKSQKPNSHNLPAALSMSQENTPNNQEKLFTASIYNIFAV